MIINESKSPDLAITSLSTESAIMVLLVDDQTMVGEAIRRLLVDQANVDFHYCSNPAEAITVATQILPTVILQDLIMPGVDGLTLVRQYRANAITKDIPIVVLSTNEDPVTKSEAFSAGANDYLVKIPDKVELIARIRYHSKAYINQLQRDEAYRALRESQKQLMETNFELQRLTNVDGLTELSNRRHLNEYLELEWKRAVRDQNPLSLLLIDVDDFKRYNDAHGHLAGDEVLKKVAETLRSNSQRSTDLPARFGGEEFALVMPATPAAGGQHVSERLRQNIEDLNVSHGASSVADYITVSIGLASVIPQRAESYVHLIETADKALYEAKRMGKNRVAIAG
jgi:two-component system chemotaxis family response regulator WspR